MIPAGITPEDVAAGFGISRATLYRELRKHRDRQTEFADAARNDEQPA